MTAARSRRAVIALGSNLGERRATIVEAVRALAATEGIDVVAVSDVVETIAVTPTGPDPSAPAYLNAVALVDTTLEAEALLDELHRIERELGRERTVRWGDRTLDLDIVTIDGVTRSSDRLTIPHPRAAEREFVLEPWLQVDPAAVLPGHGPVADLLAALRDSRTLPAVPISAATGGDA